MARIGFDRVVGYLAEPYQVMFTHRDDVEVASRLTTNAMGERMADVPELQIVDVRNPGEVADGMIPGAVNIPSASCRIAPMSSTHAGRPSCTAQGLPLVGGREPVRQRGFADVSDVPGGYGAWAEAVQNA